MALLAPSTPIKANGGRKAGLAFWLHLAAWLLSGALGLAAGTTPSRENQIKAVFLFNFAQFVEWPARAFPETQTPLVIGVLGGDPFGAFLDETVRGEKVNNRPLVIQRYRRVEEIQTCHILFISSSETNHLDQIFSNLKSRSILTVGDAEGFARYGGMIRFRTEENKSRLRIKL